MTNGSLTDEWLAPGAARSVSGLTEGALAKAAARGEVRVSEGRGQPRRYHRGDILHIAGLLRRDGARSG